MNRQQTRKLRKDAKKKKIEIVMLQERAEGEND